MALLQWLLSNGGDANIADNDGDRPLHACEDPACAGALLRAGADLLAVNAAGQTVCARVFVCACVFVDCPVRLCVPFCGWDALCG